MTIITQKNQIPEGLVDVAENFAYQYSVEEINWMGANLLFQTTATQIPTIQTIVNHINKRTSLYDEKYRVYIHSKFTQNVVHPHIYDIELSFDDSTPPLDV